MFVRQAVYCLQKRFNKITVPLGTDENMTNILRKKELRDDDSISEIQHTLIAQGLRGEKLRQAIESNKEYRRIMKRRVSRLATKSKSMSKKFVMSVDDDYEIMDLIRWLEKKKLS